MSSFYILLAVTLICGALLGYAAGLLSIILFSVSFTLSGISAYLFTPVFANVLKNNLSSTIQFETPLAFISIFVFCFLTLFLLFHYTGKKLNISHKHILNRTAGAITGLFCAAISLLIFFQFSDVVTVPKNIEDNIKNYGIAEAVMRPANDLNEKFISLFGEKQPVQVMALDTEGVIVERGVSLPFNTTSFNVRPDMELDMLQLINIERVNYGLRPLKADAALISAARAHSADMFTRGYFSHNTPDNIDPFQRLHKAGIRYRYAGENLALAPSLLKAHNGLMKSPGHRANILNAAYGKVGIGILDAGTNGLMITQEFND